MRPSTSICHTKKSAISPPINKRQRLRTVGAVTRAITSSYREENLNNDVPSCDSTDLPTPPKIPRPEIVIPREVNLNDSREFDIDTVKEEEDPLQLTDPLKEEDMEEDASQNRSASVDIPIVEEDPEKIEPPPCIEIFNDDDIKNEEEIIDSPRSENSTVESEEKTGIEEKDIPQNIINFNNTDDLKAQIETNSFQCNFDTSIDAPTIPSPEHNEHIDEVIESCLADKIPSSIMLEAQSQEDDDDEENMDYEDDGEDENTSSSVILTAAKEEMINEETFEKLEASVKESDLLAFNSATPDMDDEDANEDRFLDAETYVLESGAITTSDIHQNIIESPSTSNQELVPTSVEVAVTAISVSESQQNSMCEDNKSMLNCNTLKVESHDLLDDTEEIQAALFAAAVARGMYYFLLNYFAYSFVSRILCQIFVNINGRSIYMLVLVLVWPWKATNSR